MHTPTDRCIACHEGGSPYYTFYGTMYWVCSQDCLDQLCEWIPDVAARLIPLWQAQVEEGARAYDANEARVKAEAHVEFQKMLERERKEREKQEAAEMRERERQEERDRRERERQDERDKRERERLQREQERQEERDRREQERLEREQEKARKLWEEEQARQAEEERWKPRPLKL